MFVVRSIGARWVASIGFVMFVAACAVPGDFRHLSGADVAGIKAGMTSQEVRQKLGDPRVGRDRQGNTTYTYRFEDNTLVPPFRELYVFIDPASGKVVRVSSGTDPSRDVAGN